MEKLGVHIQKLSRRERLFFGILSLLLCAEYLVLGPFSYVRTNDTLDSIVPKSHIIWDSLAIHGITYWQPGFAGGFDRIANLGLYADIYGFFFAIPWTWIPYAVLLVLGVFLGGLFTFRLCTEMLKMNRASGFFAGTIFSFSLISSDLLYLIIGVGLLPFFLYAIEKIIASRTKNTLLYLLAFGLGTAYAGTSSLIVTLPFTAGAIAFWILLIRKKISVRSCAILCVFFIPAAALHAQEAYSLLANVAVSQRSGNYFSFSLPHYLKTVFSLLLENWIPLVLTVLGFFFIRKNRQYQLLSIGILALLFGAPLYPLLSNTYGHFFSAIRDFSFDRGVILLPFFLAISAAYALESLRGSVRIPAADGRAPREYSLHHLAAYSLILLCIFLNLSLKFSRGVLWYTQGSFLAHTYSPDLRELQDQTADNPLFRLATVSDEKTTLIPTLANFHGFETIDGHANLTTKRYVEFFRLLAKDPSIKSSLYLCYQRTPEQKQAFKEDSTGCLNPALLSLANVRYTASLLPISLPGFVRVDSGERTTYDWNDFAGFGEKAQFKLGENFSGRRLLLYENTDAFPRFFLASSMQTFDTDEKLLTALAAASTTTLRTQVFLRYDPTSPIHSLPVTGHEKRIEVTLYTPDEIRLHTTADGPSFLVVTNAWNPFWTALVNNKKTGVIPADHAFMGVYIPDTEADVVLRYEPPYIHTETVEK